MEENYIETEAAAVAQIVKELHGATVLEVADSSGTVRVPLLAVPDGMTLHNPREILDQWRPFPERRSGTSRLETLQSFVAHAHRFRDAGSVIFASRTSRVMCSVLDYHHASPAQSPRWGKHRGEFIAPRSSEWSALERLQSGLPLSDLIARLEELAECGIGDTEAACSLSAQSSRLEAAASLDAMIAQLRSVRITTEHTSQQPVGGGSGHTEKCQIVDLKTGKPIGLDVRLVVEVFETCPPIAVLATVGAVDVGGETFWHLRIRQKLAIERAAFEAAAITAAAEADLPLLFGTPEMG